MPESFWQFSHKSSEKWSDCSILHMYMSEYVWTWNQNWMDFEKLVIWSLNCTMRSSITWMDLHPKNLPKSIKKSLNPTLEVTSHLMFAAKFFKTWRCTNQINVINCSPSQNGASMLSEVWDQKEDFGLKWMRAQVKARVSSSYKVQASIVCFIIIQSASQCRLDLS